MFPRIMPLVAALAVMPLVLSTSVSAGGCHQGECYDKVRIPDLYATVAKPVVVAPAHTEIVHAPAVYGRVARTVEVAPARAYTSYSAPVYGTVAKEVVVSAGGYRWQHTVDAHGRERLCKVYTPPVTRTYHARVLLQPSQRITHVTPAVYQDVHRTVLVQPAHTHRIHHPAVVGHRYYDVLVQRGGYRWQRSW